MSIRYDNRVAIVTGAGMGLGRSHALALAARGAKVVVNDLGGARDGTGRSSDAAQKVADEIRAAGGEAIANGANVANFEEVQAMVQQAMEAWGRVDILVNNAGISAPGNIERLTLEDWRRVLDVNLTGAFLCAREAFKAMKRQGGGRIINIGSVSARVPRPHSAPYTTSKFALEGLTRALALDGRRHGIAVSILHPGNTATPIWEGEEEQAAKEGLMRPDAVARIAVMMAALPPDMNLLEGLVLPLTMPFLGRG
jgi:NAD(P)-dependent dehydrogenase (short-subunit alcohol dehydrogenase family)